MRKLVTFISAYHMNSLKVCISNFTIAAYKGNSNVRNLDKLEFRRSKGTQLAVVFVVVANSIIVSSKLFYHQTFFVVCTGPASYTIYDTLYYNVYVHQKKKGVNVFMQNQYIFFRVVGFAYFSYFQFKEKIMLMYGYGHREKGFVKISYDQGFSQYFFL